MSRQNLRRDTVTGRHAGGTPGHRLETPNVYQGRRRKTLVRKEVSEDRVEGSTTAELGLKGRNIESLKYSRNHPSATNKKKAMTVTKKEER